MAKLARSACLAVASCAVAAWLWFATGGASGAASGALFVAALAMLGAMLTIE